MGCGAAALKALAPASLETCRAIGYDGARFARLLVGACCLMVLGPIFRVELVTSARRRRYFALRVVYASVILFTLWAAYSSATRFQYAVHGGGKASISQMADTAATVFMTFSWIQLLGILAVAPAMAVGTIATERERRTIEYLFATDLSNLEIVVGKTFARLLLVGQFVACSLPILFLFRLLGGIPAGMLVASFLIAGSTALLLTALSVCVSVWAPRSRDAAMRVYRILGALLILPPILSTVAAVDFVPLGPFRDAVGGVARWLSELNPVVVLGGSMSGRLSGGAGFDFQPVLRMAGWHTAIAAALVALATSAVRRVHLRDSSSAKLAKAVRGPRRWLPRWRPDLTHRPMVWKEAFAPTSKTKLGIVASLANILVVVVAMGFTLYAFSQAFIGQEDWDRREYFYYAGTMSAVVGCGLLLLLAGRASGLVTIEKERDCWISLLSTPLTGSEIMQGKMWGNLYSARWGVLLLATAWVLGAVLDARFIAVAAVTAAAFLACACFVTNLGLMFSLRSQASLRAMGLTLLTCTFIGGLYVMCCCPILSLGSGPKGDVMAIGLAPCMPFLMAAPTMTFASDLDVKGDGEFVASYGLGLVGYVGASLVLLRYFHTRFDELAGRTAPGGDGGALSSP